jgi:hypothetical protein
MGKVRDNWTSVFSGVPDFNAELLLSANTDDGVEIGEWRWSGTYTDGSPFAMRGVTVMGIEDARIAWGRLYMEVVDATALTSTSWFGRTTARRIPRDDGW